MEKNTDSFEKLFNEFQKQRTSIFYQMPSKLKAQEFIEEFANFLFPINEGRNLSLLESESIYQQLQYQFKQLLLPIRKSLPESIDDTTAACFTKIPEIYQSLLKDASSILKFDPAATSIEEVIVAYPGFFAILVYRFTHELYLLKIPILPRLISEYAHSRTGIDIHPGATIGESFFIDHGTGIVIGETTQIHNNVKIYQGVTLGALSVEKEMAMTKRHPTIENNVVVYSGTTILGGETVIGKDSIIGGNVWLTKSVDAYSMVFNKSEISVRNKKK